MKDLLLGVQVVVKTINLEISVTSFGKLRQRILLKCVPQVQHVQHDYFSSFCQSDQCFLALSLLLSSSLLKLSIEDITSSLAECVEKLHQKT